MSSISALSTASMTMQSPRDRMNDRISAAVSSGEISATDQTALSKALDSIDSTLSSERSSGTKPSGDMKSKMESLIQSQVDNGTLTEDQATELKSFFAKGPEGKGGHGGPHGAGGPGGAGGPPPAPPSDDSDDDSTTTTSTSSTVSSSSNDVASKQLDALMTFLQQLRDTNDSASNYSASGDTKKSSSNTSATGLVVDTLA